MSQQDRDRIVVAVDKVLLKARLRKGALEIQRAPAIINSHIVLGSAQHARDTDLLNSPS